MGSETFMSMLKKAIRHKKKSVSTYRKYMESINNDEIRQIFMATLEKESAHLKLLKQIRENTRKGVDIPVDLFSGSKHSPVGGTGQFKENLNLLVQARKVDSHQKKARSSAKRHGCNCQDSRWF